MKTCQHEGCSWPVWSSGFCKFHQRDRADFKPYKFKQRKPTGEMDVFLEAWSERPHKSEISGKPLDKYEGTEFFPNLFAHICDKKNYPKFRLNKDNLFFVTPWEHILIDQGTREQRLKYERECDCSFQEFYVRREQLKQEYNER